MRTTTQTAYAEFIVRAQFAAIDGGENICGYLTDAVRDRNNALAAVWGSENLLGEADSADWWQIAYTNCIRNGYMKADPSYLNQQQREKLFKQFNLTIPAAVMKAIYNNDSSYLEELSSEQRVTLASLGGPQGYQGLMDGVKRA